MKNFDLVDSFEIEFDFDGNAKLNSFDNDELDFQFTEEQKTEIEEVLNKLILKLMVEWKGMWYGEDCGDERFEKTVCYFSRGRDINGNVAFEIEGHPYYDGAEYEWEGEGEIILSDYM